MMEDDFPPVQSISKHEYYKDKVVYFYYQFSRTEDLKILRAEFSDFIQVLKIDRKNPEFETYALQIYKLVLHTRDQYNGKGEHDISYMLIDVLYEHMPTIALACLYQFVNPCYCKQAFGSWRDIKYLCEYTKNEKLIVECIEITNNTLTRDIINSQKCFEHMRNSITNIAKWIPRENTRFGWLFERLAIDWSKRRNKHILEKATT